jgi:hypothetical protein
VVVRVVAVGGWVVVWVVTVVGWVETVVCVIAVVGWVTVCVVTVVGWVTVCVVTVSDAVVTERVGILTVMLGVWAMTMFARPFVGMCPFGPVRVARPNAPIIAATTTGNDTREVAQLAILRSIRNLKLPFARRLAFGRNSTCH